MNIFRRETDVQHPISMSEIKKKLAKQKEKAQKREFKKENNNKGKSFEEMIIYVDINGNFTDVPPHLQVRP